MIWLILACTSPETTAEDTEYPYVIQQDSTVADIDFEALAEHFTSVLPEIRSYSVKPYIDSYLQLIEQSDGYCPTWSINQEGQQFWNDYCQTSTGHQFEGTALAPLVFDNVSNEYGQTYSGHALWGFGRIDALNGSMISLNGSTQYIKGFDQNGGEFISSYIEQGHRYSIDGTTTFGPSPNLSSYIYRTATDHRYVHLNGLYTTAMGIMLLEDVILANFEHMGCHLEPSGSISFFLPEVGWIDFTLDGPTGEEIQQLTAECDGCISAYLKGVPIGEICIDFVSLLDWEEDPFE